MIEILDGLIPNKKTKTVLEEAEWEDDNIDGTFDRELMVQCESQVQILRQGCFSYMGALVAFETLRVYRPRLLLHGRKGLGQRFYGAALLHHLEGYHVQNLDIATLLGQSTAVSRASDSCRVEISRTHAAPLFRQSIETMLVQMFVEAKRHQPSVLYIPALNQWSAVLTPTAKATFGALLDSLTPAEPIIVIAFMDEPVDELDADVRDWFGRMNDNCIELMSPEKVCISFEA
jgi:SpoVK/Ycf46/Vps4 family AAA+-type ATPase